MLALGTGMAIGNMRESGFSKTLKLCLVVMLLGLCIAFFMSFKTLVLTLLALTFLSGGLVAGGVLNKQLILGTAIVCGLGLGSSVLPMSGQFLAGHVLILANLAGIGLLVWGSATLSNWAQHRQTALWPNIGIRIMGSWLLAISALMLALELAGMGSL